MNFIKTAVTRISSLCKNINEKREKNTGTYKMTNAFLTFLFPVFIVMMAELNQGKYPSKLIMFIVNRPTVMIFNIIVAAAVFAFLCMILKKCWRAAFLQSIVYMALSITELFKYGTNGNHLIMTDMKLIKSVKSLTSFAYIKITPALIIYCLIVIAYFGFMFWYNPQLKIKPLKRVIPAATCATAVLALFFVPSYSLPVYSFFDLDTTEADNVFLLNEKFDHNSFLAFFVETATENISNKLKTPDNYSEEAIESYLSIDVENEKTDFKKPNVIVVMSEAFADFREFDELNVDSSAYAGFDKVASEGAIGRVIVPTFASYTVRTEFELLFGLPVKSLNDPNMPQRMLAQREQPSIVRYYKAFGYNTAYVHPFLRNFYSRERVYGTFGFDQMLFEDDLTVPVEYHGSYIKDSVVFDQIEELIKQSDEPLYVHTTTMQNHQPYSYGTSDKEIDNYISNIKLTADALAKFTDDLKKIDEPTLLFVVGDHFPSFKNDENNVYDQLGINSSTCQVVYEQNYYLWSNYGQDFSDIPENKISAFYIPYVILDLLDAPKDTFVQAMMDKMEELPVYSTQYDASIENDSELDVLTYDRVIGENISGE